MGEEATARQAYSFYARLDATDGGEPLELYEYDGGATIERGEDNVVAEGDDLEDAWENYLYIVDGAPINDSDLAAMWVEYDRAPANAVVLFDDKGNAAGDLRRKENDGYEQKRG